VFLDLVNFGGAAVSEETVIATRSERRQRGRGIRQRQRGRGIRQSKRQNPERETKNEKGEE